MAAPADRSALYIAGAAYSFRLSRYVRLCWAADGPRGFNRLGRSREYCSVVVPLDAMDADTLLTPRPRHPKIGRPLRQRIVGVATSPFRPSNHGSRPLGPSTGCKAAWALSPISGYVMSARDLLKGLYYLLYSSSAYWYLS